MGRINKQNNMNKHITLKEYLGDYKGKQFLTVQDMLIDQVNKEAEANHVADYTIPTMVYYTSLPIKKCIGWLNFYKSLLP